MMIDADALHRTLTDASTSLGRLYLSQPNDVGEVVAIVATMHPTEALIAIKSLPASRKAAVVAVFRAIADDVEQYLFTAGRA